MTKELRLGSSEIQKDLVVKLTFFPNINRKSDMVQEFGQEVVFLFFFLVGSLKSEGLIFWEAGELGTATGS